MKPMRNISVPMNPNMCMGFMPKVLRNHRLIISDLAETSTLGKVGDEAMHLSIHLNVLHHIATVCLQSAVEIVQVVNAAHHSCRCVEQLCWNGLRQRVTFATVHLVSTHEIIPIFFHHSIELGDFVWAVLQVGIHRDDHIAFRFLNALRGNSDSILLSLPTNGQ